ncbi:pentatricopeptide repeat-containing protein At2g03880, mitochondrial isoform X2 [Andrographis paniculata]|uniref:pentatricopeptide repeat-containing protein At2g03880, mitochondrial isoform X2 n=1 Tax=Andrographis paniculata TaxID=175694 RepID=UPI0021E8F170|nr:pentatricopeptide repeat-containing protein At2g03880, mitochondrial isoform X2 [Andrographis paniculata]
MKPISRFKWNCITLQTPLSKAACRSFAQITSIRDHHRNIVNEFTMFCYQRNLQKAMKTLDAMEEHKLWADSITYGELIKCCISHRAIKQGKRVHNHVFSNGYDPKTFLINALLNMYVKFNLLDEAQALFDRMPERNFVSWTTMISAYSSADFDQKALRMLVMMLRDGARPNMYTFSSVLRACQGFSDLKQLHSFIIKNSDGDESMNLFIAMKRSGFSPDQSTLTSVLRACTSLALLELGRQVHVNVLKFDRDLVLNNALLDMYCKCGSLEDANRIFCRMVVKDVISWSTMIIGFAQNGYSQRALDLFNAMKVSGPNPNYITMLGVLFACSHAGLLNEGMYYFESMKKLYGIDPGREHYGCVIDLLGRAGKFDNVMKLIREMKCEPDAVTWRALLGACRVHRKMDLAEFAAKKVLSLDPHDAGTHILLSNMYAKAGRWEDVENLRKAMKDGGIKKEPGCSWIEIDKEVHAFVLGDKSHPQTGAIYRELNQVLLRLKEEGYVPDTNFVLQDLEGEQMESSLAYHSEKLAMVFGWMSLSKEKTIRIRKNLRICGDCHVFAKMLSKMESRRIVIRDPIRYHHFRDGVCSCGDFW